MQVIDVVRRFSKTPLKHRMSRYLLDCLAENEDLLSRMMFVTTLSSLPDTMIVAQAGADGPSFELELGAIERNEVSLVNGRLVKQKKRNPAQWVHDPVQAVEVLRKFQGVLHVQFLFADSPPVWYEEVAAASTLGKALEPAFAHIMQEQIDRAISGILLKDEIDQALRLGNKETFRQKAKEYKRICQGCLWDF